MKDSSEWFVFGSFAFALLLTWAAIETTVRRVTAGPNYYYAGGITDATSPAVAVQNFYHDGDPGNGQTEYVKQVTVGSGNNLGLVVSVGMLDGTDSDRVLTSVVADAGGPNETNLAAHAAARANSDSANRTVEWWWVANPPVDTYDITATPTGAIADGSMAIWVLENMHQTSPFEDEFTVDGDNTSPITLSFTSSAGSMSFGLTISDSAGWAPADFDTSVGTLVWEEDLGNTVIGASTGTTSIEWTFSVNAMTAAGVSIQKAP